MRKLLIFIGLLTSFALMGQGTTYYVSTSGDNGNTGLSEGQAWATPIYAEANATTAGDSILLKAGDVFDMADILAITHSGSSGSPIVWDGISWGVASDTAELKAVDTSGGANVRFVTCNNVTFQNIIVNGDSTSKRGVVVGGSSEFYGLPDQLDEHDITIQGCEIKAIGSTSSGWQPGVLVRCSRDTIQDITITNNHIHHIAAHGVAVYADRLYPPFNGRKEAISTNIYIGYNRIDNFRVYTSNTGNAMHITRQVDSITVENNIMIGNRGDAVFSVDPWNSGDTVQLEVNNLIVRNNWIQQTTGSGLPAFYFDLTTNLTYAMKMHVYNNVIISEGSNPKGMLIDKTVGGDFTGSDILIAYNTIISDFNSTFQYGLDVGTVRNNIFVNNSVVSGQYAWITYSGTITHSNNLFFTNGSGVWVSENASTYTESTIVSGFEATAITGDPLFEADFSLQETSPARGEGVDISGITSDHDGNPMNEPSDLGYLQFQSTPTPSTTTQYYGIGNGEHGLYKGEIGVINK